MRNSILLCTILLSLLVALGYTPMSLAQAGRHWKPTNPDHRFGTAENWDPEGVPGAGELAIIDPTIGDIVVDTAFTVGKISIIAGPRRRLDLTDGGRLDLLGIGGEESFVVLGGSSATVMGGIIDASTGVKIGSNLNGASLTLDEVAQLNTIETNIGSLTSMAVNNLELLNGSSAEMGETLVGGGLSLSGGSTATSTSALVDVGAGNIASVFLIDEDTTWEVDGPATVANDGHAALNIQNSAVAEFLTLDVGFNATSRGDILVGNAGIDRQPPATLNASSLLLGTASPDTSLTVWGDGHVNTVLLYAAELPGSNVRFEVSGGAEFLPDGTLRPIEGQINVDDTFILARGGMARMDIASHGVVSADQLDIGARNGSMGRADIRFDGTLAVANRARVGVEGDGIVAIEAGGIVSANEMSIGADRVDAGNRGDGFVHILGAGSHLDIEEELLIGDNGDGLLQIEFGGLATAKNATVAERRAGPLGATTGSVVLKDADSLLEVEERLSIGGRGNGQIRATDAAQISAETIIIGEQLGSEGSVTLLDPGTRMHASVTIKVGAIGFGEMFVGNEAQATSENIRIANRGGDIAPIGRGVARVEGLNSAIIAGNQISIGGNGPGELTIADAATARAPHFLIGIDEPDDPSQTGTLELDFASIQAGEVEIFSTGSIVGDGDIDNFGDSVSVRNGGFIDPGHVGIHIAGDYAQQEDGTLFIDIAGRTPGVDVDQLLVDGESSLGGRLFVELRDDVLGNPFVPEEGDRFTFLRSTGGVEGTFATNELPDLPGDLAWWLDYDFASVSLEVIEFRFITGDLDGSGRVDQGDLDLILLTWGIPAEEVPATWVSNLPQGRVDQDELDGVLLNWGASKAATSGLAMTSAVPEPTTLILLVTIVACVLPRHAAKLRTGR